MSRYNIARSVLVPGGEDIMTRENVFLISEFMKVSTENFKIKTFLCSLTGKQESLANFAYVNNRCLFSGCNSFLHDGNCPHCENENCLSHTKCSVTGGGHFVMDGTCNACGLKEKVGDSTKAAL